MKCTACSNGELIPGYLDGLFPCHTCSACGGNLVMLGDYLRWQDQHPDVNLNANPPLEVHAEETERAMICPKTGGLMTKYRIAKDTEHRLDLSPTINAIWLDKGEWLLLKEQGLAGRLNNIFTDHWQHDIRSQESAEVLSAMNQRKFGDNYAEIAKFKTLFDSLESRSEVIAFLLSDDPYKS